MLLRMTKHQQPKICTRRCLKASVAQFFSREDLQVYQQLISVENAAQKTENEEGPKEE
jgi:hypothetical protein